MFVLFLCFSNKILMSNSFKKLFLVFYLNYIHSIGIFGEIEIFMILGFFFFNL